MPTLMTHECPVSFHSFDCFLFLIVRVNVWNFLPSDMFGNQRLMEPLQFLRMNGMSHLAVELKSDCTLGMKLVNIWMK